MSPKGRKHFRSLPPDILSNLPYNVIDVILMHLPSKDAVRTSVLSKKWRYHWCRLTKLKLDKSHWKSPKDLLYPTLKFTKIVYQLLTLHEGPITKFELDFADLKNCPDIDNFISFLSRSIQHLSLHFRQYEDEPYMLPSSLFRCSRLEHLTLRNCLIYYPSALRGFDRLRSMELINVTISSELLEGVISHCLLLEQLVLDSEIGSVIEIDAPMLKFFDFTGNMSFIRLKNVPLLAKVSLKNRYEESNNSDIAKVFKSCCALEHLSLKCGYYELEEVVEAPTTRLSLNLDRVKHFYLHNIFLMGTHQLSCVVWLLRSFPCLEYLEIQAIQISDEGYDAAQNTIELEHLVDVTFDHLREVKLVDFTGIPGEMQLIKLLLANSPVLKMLNARFHFRYDEDSEERSEIRSKVVAEVSSFLRASSKAEVEAVDHDVWLKSLYS